MDVIQVVPDWFRRHVLPHLTDSEHRAMQDEVRQSFTVTSFPPKYYGLLPLAAYLAAALGLHEEVHRLVRSIPDDFYVSDPLPITISVRSSSSSASRTRSPSSWRCGG